jgi:anaerobic carbon-monoxide dehydrogenase iron sulfur subunit
MKRILVDHRRCLACKACESACGTSHHPSKSLFAALGDRRTQVNVRVIQVGHEAFPLSCRHCDPADCLNACPAGAISRHEATGAVRIDPALCKACAMCAMVCPFDAISFQVTHASPYGRDVAYKCDLCTERVEAGRDPACVEACHSGALVFAELDAYRLARGKKTMRKYLLDEGTIPANVEAFRELRRQEIARATAPEP